MLEAVQTWAAPHPWRRRLALALLYLVAFVLLAIGIGEHTGVTGKDEYYLGLRTPMCMVEQDMWWVPCLDGEPRLKKPPMVYWMTRASYELFGVSLVSARLVAVAMTAALVLGVALVALELGAGLAAALFGGMVTLSFVSLFVSGRMLELDVPVAAFATLSFYALLRWYHGGGWPAALGASVLLAAGFLSKGPIVFIVSGAGALALLAVDPAARDFLRRRWTQTLAILALFAALALPWFAHVAHLYPETSARELATELSDRQFFNPSAVPLYGILLLTLPWTFVLAARLGGIRGAAPEQRRRALMLALWLALTLLPFFFIKTFERYLFGSLVPAALLIALAPGALAGASRWAARLGLILMLPLLLTLYALALWLGGAQPLLWLGVPAFAWFAVAWWRARRPERMALSAMLLWVLVMGIAYPQLDINRIPPTVLEAARDREVVFFHGPQPALLSAVLGRSLVHVDQRWRLPDALLTDCDGFLLFAEAHETQPARDKLARLDLQIREETRIGILSSRTSWANMAREGVTREQVVESLWDRDLGPVMPKVTLFDVRPARCVNP